MKKHLLVTTVLAAWLSACGDDPGSADGGADGRVDGAADTSIDTTMPVVDGGEACIGCGPCLDGTTETTAFEQTLIELPGDTWFEAPDTQMQAVCVDDSVGVGGVIGCRGVVDAWSSGAFDSGRGRMLVWGGGHDDYWGNELYAFNLADGAWERITEPSTIPEGMTDTDFFNRDPLPDGRPNSRHTYDGIEYLADLDLLWGHGGSRARDGNSTPINWFFDPTTSTWSTRAEGPGGFSNASAYDEARRRIFVKRSESLHVYDVDADVWTDVPGFGFEPLWPRYAVGGDKTGAFDPTRGLFWSVGSGEIMVWDSASNTDATDDWVTTGGGDYSNADGAGSRPDQLFESGGGDIYDASAPGFAYSTADDAFVAWPNGGPPYILDLESRAWTIGNPDGAPTSDTSGGTYGRWAYVAAFNVFVLVNAIEENVYFYKHTPGCGG